MKKNIFMPLALLGLFLLAAKCTGGGLTSTTKGSRETPWVVPETTSWCSKSTTTKAEYEACSWCQKNTTNETDNNDCKKFVGVWIRSANKITIRAEGTVQITSTGGQVMYEGSIEKYENNGSPTLRFTSHSQGAKLTDPTHLEYNTGEYTKQ